MKYLCKDDQITISFEVNNILSLDMKKVNDYLNPFFSIYPNNVDSSDIDFSIEPFEKLSIPIDFKINEAVLHLERRGKAATKKHCTETYYFYTEYNIGFYISKNKIIMYSNLQDEVDYYDLIRVLMAIYNIKMIANDYVRIHMALVKLNNKVFALIGDKEKGKTTYLLNILKINNCARSMGANDKCYISLSDAGQLITKGSFEYMGIRNKTCKSFNNLSKLNEFSSDTMLFFWPGKVLSYFCADAMKQESTNVWLMPEINFNQDTFQTEICILDEQYIEKILYNFSDANHMQWLVDKYLKYNENYRQQFENNKAIIKKALAKIKYRRLVGNPYNTDSLYESLKLLR